MQVRSVEIETSEQDTHTAVIIVTTAVEVAKKTPVPETTMEALERKEIENGEDEEESEQEDANEEDKDKNDRINIVPLRSTNAKKKHKCRGEVKNDKSSISRFKIYQKPPST